MRGWLGCQRSGCATACKHPAEGHHYRQDGRALLVARRSPALLVPLIRLPLLWLSLGLAVVSTRCEPTAHRLTSLVGPEGKRRKRRSPLASPQANFSTLRWERDCDCRRSSGRRTPISVRLGTGFPQRPAPPSAVELAPAARSWFHTAPRYAAGGRLTGFGFMLFRARLPTRAVLFLVMVTVLSPSPIKRARQR
jgi:hypothetical protein